MSYPSYYKGIPLGIGVGLSEGVGLPEDIGLPEDVGLSEEVEEVISSQAMFIRL